MEIAQPLYDKKFSVIMLLMQIKRALILYKKSAYKIYFLEHRSSILRKKMRLTSSGVAAFRKSHNEHYRTLGELEKTLRALHIKYTKSTRGRKIDYARYDFVIAVGGDGTFLEAARGVKKQLILGINSNPARSVGKFCIANGKTFKNVLKNILAGKLKLKKLQRLRLKLEEGTSPFDVLNDLLICNENPAAMSRYQLSINGKSEEQRSSGVWISTAAGSTGAIKSAGGKVLPIESKAVQYMPRELQNYPKPKYKLRGGVVVLRQSIKVRSLIRGGMIYVDGAHIKFPFGFGGVARISISPYPLKAVFG